LIKETASKLISLNDIQLLGLTHVL